MKNSLDSGSKLGLGDFDPTFKVMIDCWKLTAKLKLNLKLLVGSAVAHW